MENGLEIYQAKLDAVLGAMGIISDEKFWCRFDMALDVDGVACNPLEKRAMRFCAWGAVIKAIDDPTSKLATDIRGDDCRQVMGRTLSAISDDKGYGAAIAALRGLADYYDSCVKQIEAGVTQSVVSYSGLYGGGED